MPLVKLVFEEKEYTIECKPGEEEFLREAEKTIKKKIDNLESAKELNHSKKFLIISLLLASELNNLAKSLDDSSIDYKKIMAELNNLEDLLKKK